MNELNSAQIEIQLGNAQVQADENARLQSLRIPEQTATAPGLARGNAVHEDLSTGEPRLFDDHKDVSHDTNDLQRNSEE